MLIALALVVAGQTAVPAPPAPLPQPAPPAAPVPSDPVLDRMVAIYDQVCLKTFPDDDAVAQALTARGATELKRKEVRIYLHDDPGRGWTVADGDAKFVVTVEAPPYHACAVRRELPAPFASVTPYLAAADRYKATGPAFMKMPPMDIPHDGLKSHMEAEARLLGSESEILMVVNDTRPDGTVETRFVRQIKPLR